MSLTWAEERPRRYVAIYTREWTRAFLRGENPPPVWVDAEPWRNEVVPIAPPPRDPDPEVCRRPFEFARRDGHGSYVDECGMPLPCPRHPDGAS